MSDQAIYDLFISYVDDDAEWVEDFLIPSLKISNERILTKESFRPGVDKAPEFERAVASSRYTLLILSPAFLDDVWTMYSESIVLHSSVIHQYGRLLPLILHPCELPSRIDKLVSFDCTNEAQWKPEINRLRDWLNQPITYHAKNQDFSPTLLDFETEIETYSRGFIGRQWFNEKIDRWLESDGPNAFVLVAEPGFGKSAIAAWLYQKRNDVVGIHFCSEANPRSLRPYEFVINLVAQLCAQNTRFAKLLESKFVDVRRRTAAIAFRELIIDPLHSKELSVPSRPQIIIIDALDEAFSKGEGESIFNIVSTHIHSFPSWLRIVATTRPEQILLNQFEDMYLLKDLADTPENERDLNNYLCRRLVPLSSQFPLEENKQIVMKKIESLSEGNFLYAKKVLDALENGIFTAADIGERLTPGLSRFYNTIFNKQFPNKHEYSEVYKPILSILVAARDPLPIEIIERACDVTPEQLFGLRIFLRTAGVEENSSYTLYHKSLKDWLTNKQKAMIFYIHNNEGDRLLSNFGMQEFEDGVETMSKYSKEYLVMHLAKTRRWEDMVTLMRKDELNLLGRWTEKGYSDEGSFCLTGIVDYLRQQNRDLDLAAGLSTQIARIYNRMGKFANAEQYLQQALKIASELNNRGIQVIAHHELGSIAFYRGDKETAKKAYSTALHLCLHNEFIYHGEAAANLLGLSKIQLLQYQYSGAISFAKEALQYADEVKNTPHIIGAHRVLANAYADCMRYKEVEQHLQRAIALAKSEEIFIKQIDLQCLQGWMFYKQANLNNTSLTQAIKTFEDAASEAQKAFDIYNYISAHLGLVWCALVQCETERAYTLFLQAENSSPSELFHDLQIRMQLGRAAISHQSGDSINAKNYYKETIELSQKYSHKGREADALVGLGSIYHQKDLYDEAESCWEKAKFISKTYCSPERRELIILGIKQGRKNPSLAIPL